MQFDNEIIIDLSQSWVYQEFQKACENFMQPLVLLEEDFLWMTGTVSIQWRGKHCIKSYPNSTLILINPSVNACTIQPTLHFIGFCHTIINKLVSLTLPHISQRTLQFAHGRRISITWSDNSCFYLFWSDEAMNSAYQLDIVKAGRGSVMVLQNL